MFNEVFLNNMREQLGDAFDAFMRSYDDPPALALRLNPMKKAALAAAEPFIDAPVEWEEMGYYIKPDTRPGLSIAHAAGAFYLQEASAMLSVGLLDPRPGEKILDLCAAPGGKSTQIAGRMKNKGVLISNEPEPSRAKILAQNMERFGVKHSIVTNEYPDKLAKKWGQQFDRVLVDAPCSGEGMFRRDPASRDEWTPQSPPGCAKRQADILDSAAEIVKPGGVMVYSTCTFNRAEDEDTVSAFLARHGEFSLERTERIYPHTHRGDGHFAAKMVKSGSCQTVLDNSKKSNPPAWEVDLSALFPDFRFELSADIWRALPMGCPDLSGIKAPKLGTELLRVGRSHTEPMHALAMALEPDEFPRVANLTESEARAYMAGETIPVDAPNGWTLVCLASLPLGWGKVTDGMLKNKLPKGLRLNR